MGYISSNEDFQTIGAFDCGGNCGCTPCTARRFGNTVLAEWYEEDDEPDPPAQPTMEGRNGSAMGETPERLVLQPPSLLQPPIPAWKRRTQQWMDRNLPQLRLDPQFLTLPGGVPGVPPPPPPPSQINLRLPQQYQEDLIKRWQEQKRLNRMVNPPTSLPQRVSLGDAIRKYMDTKLESLLNELRVPRTLRGPIRGAVSNAIGKGATKALDKALSAAGVSNSQAREAIGASVRAAIEVIRVR
jgi:hypothetical protein